MRTVTEIDADILAVKAEKQAARDSFNWDAMPDWDAQLKTLEAERVKAAAREERQREREQNEQWALEWVNGRTAERAKLSDKLLAFLRGPNGRLGEWSEGLAEVIPHDHDDDLWPFKVQLCLDRLVKVRAIRKDADDKYWNPKAYYHAYPNSKERSGAVQNIGTVPDAVRFHRQVTPGRQAVAVALSDHFYTTRRSHAKARAIGIRAIAKAARVNPKTAQQALEWLKTQGLLDYVEAVGSRARVYHWTGQTKTYRKPAVPIS